MGGGKEELKSRTQVPICRHSLPLPSGAYHDGYNPLDLPSQSAFALGRLPQWIQPPKLCSPSTRAKPALRSSGVYDRAGTATRCCSVLPPHTTRPATLHSPIPSANPRDLPTTTARGRNPITITPPAPRTALH